jgi:hypothetical protein
MSFRDRAEKAVLDAATKLENEANQIGAFRSVDATESAQWLRCFARDMLDAANGIPGKWEYWVLELMAENNMCEKVALQEPFDADAAQERVATFIKDQEKEIARLMGNMAAAGLGGPAFTEDKE